MFCRARALATSVAALCLLGASPAMAEKYDSIAAAKAADDPAATAPSSGATDAIWSYHGRSISPEYARNHARVCVEDDTPVTRCYDTNAQAEGATGTAVASSHRAAKKDLRSKVKAKASCAASDGSQLKLYMDSSYNGFQLNLDSRGSWYDIPSSYNDAASSWQMGGHSGHISEHTYAQGLGYLFPGPTGVCDAGTNMSGYSYQGGGGDWNDRASARYRN